MAFRNKDPLGLELDLMVTEDDVDSLDDDLRPEFRSGMSCPVAACEGKPYTSLNTLWKHWKKYHREKIPLFKCMYPVTNGICSFSSTEVGDVRKLYLHKHKSREDMKIHRELVPNKKYIPPGEHKCPKCA